MPDNSNRNTILFVILSLALLFGYQALVLGPQNKQREAELQAREAAPNTTRPPASTAEGSMTCS